VEECARQGVSAIVLDPNNDLARLGDAWPEPPAGWGPGDAERARDYLEHTDVVVWTPGVSGGRPLSFQPLPDFAPVRDSPDEFDQAVRAAIEALAPRAGVGGATKTAAQGKAVLTEALQAYARGRTVGLEGFTDFLADLPEDVSRMARAGKLAHDLSETLKAAMVNDKLFGGKGSSADPAALLTPPPGKRARVSVISFVGLMSDVEKQGFVNQLQMALFTWLKRNPAGDRPLGGLFIMDEAQTLAPSTGTTASTASTITLASQARKYGLGLVFATQAPKGLHNQISGNATTQFFGLLNAPAQIDAARELAQAKGGRLPDIGLLGSGEFYAAGEGFSFVKVRTPLCLTHHPKAPLSPEEVLERARRPHDGK
ncbi:MAG TPA: AAA family ATPase, partial [Asanoa sp.]|nr:AAA family ATPase [Asanoa sp.]